MYRIAWTVLLCLSLAACGSADDDGTNNGAANNGAANNGATNNGATNNGATNNGATNNGATSNGTTNNGATNNGTIINEGCGATHAKVGQTLKFSQRFHDVGGTAEILDDCTIEISDFTYDGTGLDVRIYAGVGGNYGNGFPISPDLLRATAYDGESLTLTLPNDKTLDDLDGLSVWCVDVSQSFGDGTFE